MKKETTYEWSLEIKDENGDIIDNDFSTVLNFKEIPENADLVLVRNVGNEQEGLIDRSWAYVENDELDNYFKRASGNEISKMPHKFKTELYNYLKC